jgi:hypothetical protein
VGGLIGLYAVVVGFTRAGELHQKGAALAGSGHSYLNLNSRDDYHSVTRKLGGPPASDHQEELNGVFYRALGYPGRGFTVVLAGADPSTLTYIGTMDANWRTIRSANAQSAALLRSLKRF